MTEFAKKYSRKVERRHGVLAITPNQLVEHPELVDKDIWELGYVSTSDEDDQDEDEDEEEDYDDEEESEEEDSSDDSTEEKKGDEPKAANSAEPS